MGPAENHLGSFKNYDVQVTPSEILVPLGCGLPLRFLEEILIDDQGLGTLSQRYRLTVNSKTPSQWTMKNHRHRNGKVHGSITFFTCQWIYAGS